MDHKTHGIKENKFNKTGAQVLGISFTEQVSRNVS
jgi:hypothetical protein